MRPFTPTENQRILIELTEGCHLVHAPPGTGKTEVLTRRIIRLLAMVPGGTFRILGLTFTTKAAENLRQRVKEGVGDDARRMNACTFHSFCLDALQHYGHFVDFASDTTVYESEADRLDVLSRALEEEGLPAPDRKRLRELLTRIGVAKRALRQPESLSDDPELASAFAGYDRVLRRFHGCDFDDLLSLAWRLLTESPKVARHYRKLYRYIMVDEAQDTSRAQYEILRAICGDEHRNVMMVADSNQFIYRFAGASDQWLESFLVDFDAVEHKLNENFRCAKAIVTVANRLIDDQPDEVPEPPMVPAKAAPGEVRAVSYADELAEARGVAGWLQERLARGISRAALHESEAAEVGPEDMCVLCRNRYGLDAIKKELEGRGVPLLFRAGRQLVETREAQLVLQGLKILQNPADLVTRESVVAEWAEGLLDTAVAELSFGDFFARLGAAAPDLAAFVDLLVAAGASPDVGSLVRSLAAAIEGRATTARGEGNEEHAALLVADAGTLRARWKEYAGHVVPDARSLRGFLAELALGGKSVIEGPGVRILTIHVAKGLEFKAVALVGMNEGTLPDYRSLGCESDLADEIRVAYVAVTRASRSLLLTRPRSRVMPWGDTRPQDESRFVDHMGLVMEEL